MLTESEKLWLHNRQAWRAIQRHGRRSEWYSCVYCDYSGNKELCGSSPCRLEFSVASLIDALEFSERVAAKLAEIMPRALADPWFIENAKHINADVTLKWARLSVEEEMDNDNS